MFSDAFAKNKLVEQRLRELNYEPSKFYVANHIHKWYNELFKLPKEFEAKHEAFMRRTKPTADSTLICAQIRIGVKTAGGNATDAYFMPRNDTILFWNFIKEEFLKKQNMTKKNYKIFVVTDHEDIKFEASEHFEKGRVIFHTNASFHFGRDFPKPNEKGCKALQNVLFDFYLLGHCDVAVVSHSGYGLLGVLNRRNPYDNFFVYTLKDQNEMKKGRLNKEMHFRRITNIYEDIEFA